MKRIIRKDVKLKDKDNKLYNITRTIPINNEETFNNSSKYITEFPNNSLLEEFPEYLNGYNNVIATNTGLMCFYKDEDLAKDNSGNSIAKELIIYDILASDDIKISSISPDIAPMLDYNHITNPLNVRHLNFSEGKFLPDKEYNNGSERYILIDCDNLTINTNDSSNDNFVNCEKDNNFYFKYQQDTNPEKVGFNYRPIIVVRVFNSNGTPYTGVLENFINKTSGVFYRDYTIKKPAIQAAYISINAPSTGSGYMEVL